MCLCERVCVCFVHQVYRCADICIDSMDMLIRWFHFSSVNHVFTLSKRQPTTLRQFSSVAHHSQLLLLFCFFFLFATFFSLQTNALFFNGKRASYMRFVHAKFHVFIHTSWAAVGSVWNEEETIIVVERKDVFWKSRVDNIVFVFQNISFPPQAAIIEPDHVQNSYETIDSIEQNGLITWALQNNELDFMLFKWLSCNCIARALALIQSFIILCTV